MTTQTSPNMSRGHIAQIIRRMTVQKSVQSKKTYKRNKMKKVDF